MSRKFLGRAQSIVAAILLGLGIFILRENLNSTTTQLNHFLGPEEALGTVTGSILAARHIWQLYAADRQQFLQGLLYRALMSSWPLLLVVAGAVLSRAPVATGMRVTPKEKGVVDLLARRSTSK
jgi:hypothetical protein